jgi:hypothetical protein
MAVKQKKYKHADLMVEKGVKSPCPFKNCEERDRQAYHFGFSDKDDIRNFIPGHKKRYRINANSDEQNCAYCALSMFKTADGARKKWNQELTERTRQLLQYTHLLVGDIKKELGVMSIEKGDHFTFFEYEGTNLQEHFQIFDEL